MFQIASWILAALVGGFMGYFIARGNSIAALAAFLVGFAALLLANALHRRRLAESGMIDFDEMHYAIAEKSGYLAYRASLIAIALMLLALWASSLGETLILPAGLCRVLMAGLGLCMAIMTVAYFAAYLYYLKSRKPIEGR